MDILPCKNPLLCVFEEACPANDLFIFFYSIFTAITSSHHKMIIIIMIILIINITKSIQVHNKAVG